MGLSSPSSFFKCCFIFCCLIIQRFPLGALSLLTLWCIIPLPFYVIIVNLCFISSHLIIQWSEPGVSPPFHLIIITHIAYENNANLTLHLLIDDDNNPYFLRILHLSWRRSLWYHAGWHDESHRSGQCKRHPLMPTPLDFILLSLFPISFKEINSTRIHNKIWWLI